MEKKQSKSTGPITPQGKAKSSQNSKTHGMRSAVFQLLADESPAEYAEHCQMWQKQYEQDEEDGLDPALPALVETLAQNDWLQMRGMRNVSKAELRLAQAEADGAPLEVIQHCHQYLLLMLRYKTAAENSFQKALRAVEQFQGRRKREELQERTVYMKECDTADRIVSRRQHDERECRAPLQTVRSVMCSGDQSEPEVDSNPEQAESEPRA
jgi:hypothetical protein